MPIAGPHVVFERFKGLGTDVANLTWNTKKFPKYSKKIGGKDGQTVDRAYDQFGHMHNVSQAQE